MAFVRECISFVLALVIPPIHAFLPSLHPAFLCPAPPPAPPPLQQSGDVYYYNTETKETSWHPPKEVFKETSAAFV